MRAAGGPPAVLFVGRFSKPFQTDWQSVLQLIVAAAHVSKRSVNMIGCELFLALSVVGVDFGWQANEQGKLEYIIQIEPELLSSLSEGREIVSFIAPEVRGVRCFRVRVGNTPPPRDMSAATAVQPTAPDVIPNAVAPSNVTPNGVAPIPSPDQPNSSRRDLTPRGNDDPIIAPSLINPAGTAAKATDRRIAANRSKSRSSSTSD